MATTPLLMLRAYCFRGATGYPFSRDSFIQSYARHIQKPLVAAQDARKLTPHMTKANNSAIGFLVICEGTPNSIS